MGLKENIFRDTISDLELRELIALAPDTPVRQAVTEMRRMRLGCVIVVDPQGKPIGKFTERKLMKLLLDDPQGLDKPIKEFMYNDPDAIGVYEPVAKLVNLMKSRRVRFVCAVDKDGKAIALTGQRGMMEYIAEHFPRQVKSQRMKPLVSLPEREGA